MSGNSNASNERLLEQQRRESYVRSVLNALIPSQIRGLRINQNLTQAQLAEMTGMKQARVSASERPGEVSFNLETIIRFAAAFKAGLVVKIVPLHEMEAWEDDFSQDEMHISEAPQESTDVYRSWAVPIISTRGEGETILPVYSETTITVSETFGGYPEVPSFEGIGSVPAFETPERIAS